MSVSLSLSGSHGSQAPPCSGLSQPAPPLVPVSASSCVFPFPTSAGIAQLHRLKAAPWNSGSNCTSDGAGTSETRTEQRAEIQKRRLKSETPEETERPQATASEWTLDPPSADRDQRAGMKLGQPLHHCLGPSPPQSLHPHPLTPSLPSSFCPSLTQTWPRAARWCWC